MSGDPTNTAIWEDADVFVAFDLDTADPATIDDDFAAGWERVGLLDGAAGFGDQRAEEVTDHYAWGGILYRTGRRNFKLTKTFTALERNALTDELENPGSTASQIIVPKPVRVKIAFEQIDGDDKYRLISAFQAEIVRTGDSTVTESDPETIPFTATIFPDTDKVLFNRQSTKAADLADVGS